MTQACHACGAQETIAQVSDMRADACYNLCAKCLYGAWPPWEERKARILKAMENMRIQTGD